MQKCTFPICPKIRKRLEHLKSLKGWISRYCGNGAFEIVGSYNQYKVKLEEKTCGRRKWELSGIPCVHAICEYNHLHMEPMDYVHDCYKVETYLKCYSYGLGPINGRDLWPKPDSPTMLPPDVKKRAGRPKRARRREPEEEPPADPHRVSRKGVKMTCGKCGKIGHNRRGSKVQMQQGANKATEPVANEPSQAVPASESVPNAATETASNAVPSGTTMQSGITIQSGSGITGPTTRRKLAVKRGRKIVQVSKV